MPDEKNMNIGAIQKAIGPASYYELLASKASAISMLALDISRALRGENHTTRFVNLDGKGESLEDLKEDFANELQEFYAYAMSNTRYIADAKEMIKYATWFLKENTQNDPDLSDAAKEAYCKTADYNMEKVLKAMDGEKSETPTASSLADLIMGGILGMIIKSAMDTNDASQCEKETKATDGLDDVKPLWGDSSIWNRRSSDASKNFWSDIFGNFHEDL